MGCLRNNTLGVLIFTHNLSFSGLSQTTDLPCTAHTSIYLLGLSWPHWKSNIATDIDPGTWTLACSLCVKFTEEPVGESSEAGKHLRGCCLPHRPGAKESAATSANPEGNNSHEDAPQLLCWVHSVLLSYFSSSVLLWPWLQCDRLVMTFTCCRGALFSLSSVSLALSYSELTKHEIPF